MKRKERLEPRTTVQRSQTLSQTLRDSYKFLTKASKPKTKPDAAAFQGWRVCSSTANEQTTDFLLVSLLHARLTLSLKFSRICLSRKGLERSAAFRKAWIQSSQKRLLTGEKAEPLLLEAERRYRKLRAQLASVEECGRTGGAVQEQVRVAVLGDGLAQRSRRWVLLGQTLQAGRLDEPGGEQTAKDPTLERRTLRE